MNGEASELYNWGPPKLKNEWRLIQIFWFAALKAFIQFTNPVEKFGTQNSFNYKLGSKLYTLK